MNERFKIIEKSSVEKVVEVAATLIERGYQPVAEIMKMPDTKLFTQVMHWQPTSGIQPQSSSYTRV